MLPEIEGLSGSIRELVSECTDLLPDGGEPIEVLWAPAKKGGAKKGDD